MAKSFLAAQSSSFTISDDNVSVIGQSGNQVITLLSTASGASFTQTVERVIFEGASNSYSYKNNAGKLEVYSASTLIATINPQDDATGTQLTFSDASVSLAYGTADSLTFGGVIIDTLSHTSLTPTTFVTTLEGDAAGASSAKIFLESSESSFTIHDDNITMVGQANTQTITIKAGVTGATLPQTIENLIFEGISTDYTYANNAGKLEVYSGSNLIAAINPQDDSTGTQLAFTNETTDVKFGTSGGLTLGGATVSTDTPTIPTEAPTTAPTEAPTTHSFSNTNNALGTLSNSSTFGVSTLDSGYHWSSNPITYSFNTAIPESYYTSSDGLTANWTELTAGQKTAVRAIVEELNKILATPITEVTSTGDIRFNVISMDSGTAAFAYQPFGTSYDYAGDVFLSQSFNTDQSNYGLNQGEFGWLTIAHETGHAMGLDHPFSESNKTSDILATAYDDTNHTIMSYTDLDNKYYSFSTDTTGYINATSHTIYSDSYSLYDVEALQVAYGADTTTNTQNNTYTVNYTDYEIQTIWDAGGVDTIDLSSALGDSTIDLNSATLNSADQYTVEEIVTLQQGLANYPYHNSWIQDRIQDLNTAGTLYTGKNNLGIAQGVIIENLLTGVGADTVHDNEVNNTITTGAGNDTIYLLKGGSDAINGGSGTDTLYISDAQSSTTLAATSEGYTLTGTYFDATLIGVEQISYNGTIVAL